MARLAGFFDFISPLFKIIIEWLYGLIGNYGWTIVLFTVMLKLVTLPLDVWQKYSMKKTQIMQLEMAPDLARINERYKNNKNELNQKTMECYKKHKFSPVGGCLPMVINLLLILFIYASMFTGMNTVSANITKDNYLKFQQTYEQTYAASTLTDANEKVVEAQNAVITLYKNDNSVQNKFLWIESISRKDANVRPIPSFAEFKKSAGESFITENGITKENYDNVMGGLSSSLSRWNGYYILPILVIAVSFLSTYITGLGEKKKSGIAQQQTNILMKIMMPAILGVLCFTTAATFGIYLLANSLITLLAGFGVDPIVNLFMKKYLTRKIESKKVVEYSR